MPYTTNAMSVARWFVDRANNEFVDEGVTEGLTNLKLQKLLYFAQAASLSLKGEPLFNEKIEAWKFGPVIPDVYHALKESGSQPIKMTLETEELSPEAKFLLEDVWNIYGKFAAHELVNITHSHLPWKQVYFASVEGQGNKEITKEAIKEYYASYYQAA